MSNEPSVITTRSGGNNTRKPAPDKPFGGAGFIARLQIAGITSIRAPAERRASTPGRHTTGRARPVLPPSSSHRPNPLLRPHISVRHTAGTHRHLFQASGEAGV